MKKAIILIALITTTIFACAQYTTTLNDSTQPTLLERVENWYAENMNYATITTLMAVESSFIPFPSEIVIPPAAYVAGKEDSTLHVTDSYPINVLLIVLFGTIGAMLGAIINYLLAM